MIKRTEYLEALKKRAKESRVYKKYQLDGLEIAQLLDDNAHKALYIKLFKNGNAQELRALAASVAEREGVKNKGALFMYLLHKSDLPKKKSEKKPKTAKQEKKSNGLSHSHHR